MSFRLDWNGTEQELIRRLEAYEAAVKDIVKRIATFWYPQLEEYAKTHAPWTDRTANARQTLHAWMDEVANDAIEIYLAHGMDYGFWLEVKNPTQKIDIVGLELSRAGKYAIVLPTIEQYFPQIMSMIQDVLK